MFRTLDSQPHASEDARVVEPRPVGGAHVSSSRAYYTDINKVQSVTDPQQERVLVRLWQRVRDKRARDVVVNSHLRFVVKRAHQKTRDASTVQDYIAAGNLGLLKAIEPGHFNPDRQPYIRFLTYASSWVYKEMMDLDYASNSLVHVPTHRQKEQRRKAHARRVAEAIHGPGSSEANDLAYVRNADLVVELGEVNEDELNSDLDTVDRYHAKKLGELVERVLAILPPREALILRLHFGVKDEPRSLVQIARLMEVTPECVRQIKVRALGMVRKHLSHESDDGVAAIDV